MAMNITTERLIIHEAEPTHKYHHKHPLEIRGTRKKKLKQTTYETLGKLEENQNETSGYFTVASCPPMPRPRAHALNKQKGKPAGQDTAVTGSDGAMLSQIKLNWECYQLINRSKKRTSDELAYKTYVLELFALSSILSLSTTLPCLGKISVAWAATRGKLWCAAWEVLVVVVVNSSL